MTPSINSVHDSAFHDKQTVIAGSPLNYSLWNSESLWNYECEELIYISLSYFNDF